MQRPSFIFLFLLCLSISPVKSYEGSDQEVVGISEGDIFRYQVTDVQVENNLDEYYPDFVFMYDGYYIAYNINLQKHVFVPLYDYFDFRVNSIPEYPFGNRIDCSILYNQSEYTYTREHSSPYGFVISTNFTGVMTYLQDYYDNLDPVIYTAANVNMMFTDSNDLIIEIHIQLITNDNQWGNYSFRGDFYLVYENNTGSLLDHREEVSFSGVFGNISGVLEFMRVENPDIEEATELFKIGILIDPFIIIPLLCLWSLFYTNKQKRSKL